MAGNADQRSKILCEQRGKAQMEPDIILNAMYFMVAILSLILVSLSTIPLLAVDTDYAHLTGVADGSWLKAEYRSFFDFARY